MTTPLVRTGYCWILLLLCILNVGCFHGCTAFVPRLTTATPGVVSSRTQPCIHIAAAVAASGSNGRSAGGGGGSTRKQQNHHEKWQPYYDALTEFKNQHGHCEVTVDENASLCAWLEDQRKSYRQMKLGRKTKLTKKRAIALEMLGAIPSELLEL